LIIFANVRRKKLVEASILYHAARGLNIHVCMKGMPTAHREGVHGVSGFYGTMELYVLLIPP
jgi:hypothetical protein